MKKALRYHRFSNDGQSNSSIERQDMFTSLWCERTNVHIVDTFGDEGFTARNFDRPDIKLLFEFIKKNYRGIDYLVVSELTRFSRATGDAINMVQKIQSEYGVKIVSAIRGSIYDCNDHMSFFMMGLEFLLGNSENIKRINDINGGIYAAKAKEGRYIGSSAPYGYMKEGHGKDKHLVVKDDEAAIVRFIYSSYLKGTPIYVIKMDAKDMGFDVKGKCSIERILTNPIYAGMQLVKANKDLPGGLFPVKLDPIIDVSTWNEVQNKLKKPARKRTTISEEYPLRGVLLCHCNNPLTAAASRGRHGNYFGYYKCQTVGHNTINSKHAHDQLQEVLNLLSLPEYLVDAIREESELEMRSRMKESQKLLYSARQEQSRLERQLRSVEEKWINNQLPAESFHKWFQDITDKRIQVSADIEKYSRDDEEAWWLLSQELEKLTDLRFLYNSISVPDKQELIRQVFDNRLYYKEKVYRTPYIMEAFSHNLFILNQKQLLILDGWGSHNHENPARWSSGGPNRTLPDLLSFLSRLKVA